MGRKTTSGQQKGANRDRVLKIVAREGVVRPRDLHAQGINRMVLTRLTEQGILERVSWGLYRLSKAEPMGDPDLVLVAARVPNAVIGLVSALSHHGLTSEIPRVVDLLLPRGMSTPKLDYPPLRVFWVSGASSSEGVEEVLLDRVRTRITNPAKTVADCFKFRRRIGMAVATEALAEGLAQGAFTPAEFAQRALANRVLAVARPYLDSLS